jgi:proprotein convertase subtilisin/kexin type 2
MWTISINSAINDGRTALYDESCSSTLASTFSNGRSSDPEAGVATTDLYGQCTLRHSGTSAAAPEAAGVFALTLEAKCLFYEYFFYDIVLFNIFGEDPKIIS